MRILPFPSDVARLIDKMDLADWFDLIIDKQELMSIGTGRLQKLTDKARLTKSNIFEYRSRLQKLTDKARLTKSNIFEYRSRLLSHSGTKVRQNVYYKIATDEKDLRNQFMVMTHMNS